MNDRAKCIHKFWMLEYRSLQDNHWHLRQGVIYLKRHLAELDCIGEKKDRWRVVGFRRSLR